MSLKKFFFISFLFFGILFLSLALVIYVNWQEFQTIREQYQGNPVVLSETQNETFVLNKKSHIIKEDLLNLLPFLEIPQEPVSWWDEQVNNHDLAPVGSTILNQQKLHVFELNTSFEFELERRNECSYPYCFQRKLHFFDIPSQLWRGLIGIEDERFLLHKGVDPWALLRALMVDIKEGRFAQGGSTITQQVARNLYLGNQKSFSRKYKEILFSFFMEWELSKEEILQIYFNEVFWGSVGGVRIQGVFAASLLYFKKRPTELTPYEVSILVAMLKGPNFYGHRFPEKLRERGDLVFNKLLEMKLIPKESTPWKRKEWHDWLKNISQTEKDGRLRIIVELLKRKKSQLDFYAEYVYATAADNYLQNLKLKPQLKDKDLAYKIFVTDLSCIYGEPKAEPCQEPFFFYSKFERSQEIALKEDEHQVGSLLKPAIYRFFVQQQKKMDDVVSTLPITLKLKSGDWEPQESTIENLPTEITLRMALQKSRNIPLIHQANDLGFVVLEKFLKPDYLPSLKTPLAEYPSQLLGSLELNILELNKFYEKFFHDECDDILQEKLHEENSPLYVLSDPTQTTIARSADPQAAALKFFGKTGTSNKGNDNWFVSFDGRFIYITWIGNEAKEEKISLQLSGAWTSYKAYEYFLLYRGQLPEPLNCEIFRPIFLENNVAKPTPSPSK